MVTVLGFLPLPTSHPFQKSLCARSRVRSQHARAHVHVHAGTLPTSHRGLPPQPICSRKRFKYVNGRCFRHPINVIAFDIQHLHAWRRFPASDRHRGDPSSCSTVTCGPSEELSQASPSPGCDLIFGAAAERGSLTAIKLRDNSKKKKKKRKKGVGGWGGKGLKGGGCSGEISLCHLPADGFLPEHLSQTRQPRLPLMSPSRPRTRRVTDAALTPPFFFSFFSPPFLSSPSYIPHPTFPSPLHPTSASQE